MPGQIGLLADFLHWACSWWRKCSAFVLKVVDNIVNHFEQLNIELNRIIAVDPRDQVGTPPDIGLIFFTPFNPFMKPIRRLHCCTRSIASLCSYNSPSSLLRVLRLFAAINPVFRTFAASADYKPE